MNSEKIIVVYADYKSPYAYLAKDQVYELERDFGVTVHLGHPEFFGKCASR